MMTTQHLVIESDTFHKADIDIQYFDGLIIANISLYKGDSENASKELELEYCKEELGYFDCEYLTDDEVPLSFDNSYDRAYSVDGQYGKNDVAERILDELNYSHLKQSYTIV